MTDGLHNLDQWESAFERRSIGRTRIAKSALLFFAGQAGVRSCAVRDMTNIGAGIRIQDLPQPCRRILNCRSIEGVG